MSVFVILPAAGIGTRMNSAGAAPKQFLYLKGLPILVHSLRAFLAVPRVAGIYIAVRASEKERLSELLAEYKLGERVHIVTGGDSRQDSVANALTALPSASPDDIVLVHDAVRPFTTHEIIASVIDAAHQHGAAIAGWPAVDTVKQVERTADGALIKSTIPRASIVMAQTPQGFRYPLLKKAFDDAALDGFLGTDEASLIERAGSPVVVVMGSPRNIKITTPADLELAEFYLKNPIGSPPMP